MKAYRYLTGFDDSAFCHRVTDLLNRGWELAGPATLAFNAAEGRMICGQPMQKDLPELEYDPDMKLSEL